LFRPTDEAAPSGWERISARPIVQMVADGTMPEPAATDSIVPLGEADPEEVVALAEAARPGPLGRRTVLLGHYVGVRRDGRLVAMAGERFRLQGHVELSAICFHPEWRGVGFGSGLTRYLAHRARAHGEIPFLHVFPENAAMRVYARLGFRERARLWVLWRRPQGGDHRDGVAVVRPAPSGRIEPCPQRRERCRDPIHPALVLLIDKTGFVVAAALVGVGMTATIWPLAGRFLGPTPETKGVAPDGEASSQRVQDRQPQRQARPLRALFRDRRFATLSAGFALGFFAQIGLVTHLVERLAPVLGGAGAATAVGAAALCAVPGRLLLGGLLGRADHRLAAAGNFAMQACGVALLALTSGTPTLLMGCALFGLGIGNLVLLPPIIAQAEFEPADIPRVVATVTAVNQAVFAFAPLAFGLLHDLTGGYAVPFTAAAVCELAAGTIVLTGREMLNGGQCGAHVIREPGALKNRR
jgi:ribosomal protein S18 acetylase RimI-like enzyme